MMEQIFNQLKTRAASENVKLNEAADSKTIKEFEKTMEVSLSDSLLQFYSTFNGSSNFLNHWKIFSLKETQEYVNKMPEFNVYDDSLAKFSWNRNWIPLATDRSGNLLCVNLDPETELSSDRTNIPIDFYNCGDLFMYWQDENRIASESLNLEEWISEYILSIY
jgi:cell wall assembly regulator SMI1